MATYSELVTFYGTPAFDSLKNKIKVALSIKAKALADLATPTQDQIDYAIKAISHPNEEAGFVINYVLAANSGLSIAAITGASDNAIQNNVNSAVDDLLALTIA